MFSPWAKFAPKRNVRFPPITVIRFAPRFPDTASLVRRTGSEASAEFAGADAGDFAEARRERRRRLIADAQADFRDGQLRVGQQFLGPPDTHQGQALMWRASGRPPERGTEMKPAEADQ